MGEEEWCWGRRGGVGGGLSAHCGAPGTQADKSSQLCQSLCQRERALEGPALATKSSTCKWYTCAHAHWPQLANGPTEMCHPPVPGRQRARSGCQTALMTQPTRWEPWEKWFPEAGRSVPRIRWGAAQSRRRGALTGLPAQGRGNGGDSEDCKHLALAAAWRV